jgi:hypothetical protein
VKRWAGSFERHEVQVALEACTGWLFVSRALERAGAVAVAAAVRHGTDYDDLLMKGVDRAEARERVRADVDQVLESWRTPLD